MTTKTNTVGNFEAGMSSTRHSVKKDEVIYVIGHSMFLVSLIISDLYYHKRIEGRLAF